MKAIGLVFPQEVRDGELAGQVLLALARDGDIQSDDIEVWVEGQSVTLLGTAGSPYERDRAGTLAAGIPGVEHVDNRIAIAEDHYLSDTERLERVRSALAADPVVGRYRLGAQVQRGVVTLLGQVGSLEDERIAIQVAERVPGVRQVVSALRVGPIAPADEPLPITDDALLLSDLNDAIAAAGVTIYEDATYVRDGVAHVRGRVANRAALERALEAARHVRGIRAVRNELAIMADPSSQDPNEALMGTVIQALREDPRINPSQVTPLVADGVVILTGQVDSIEDYNAAMEVVAQVPGVTNVVNEIRLLGRHPLRADDRHDLEKSAVGSPHGGPQ